MRVDAGKKVPTDRYFFDPQKTNVRVGKDVYFGDGKIGEVVAIDHTSGVVDIKKTKKTAEVHPPTVYMWDSPLPTDAQAGSIYRIGEWVSGNGIGAPGRYRAGREPFLRKPPLLLNRTNLHPPASDKPAN